MGNLIDLRMTNLRQSSFPFPPISHGESVPRAVSSRRTKKRVGGLMETLDQLEKQAEETDAVIEMGV